MSRPASVGTLQWARCGGALARRDRRRLLAQAMLARLGALPHRWKRRLGLSDRDLARVDPAALRVPDSPAALQATELLAATSAPWLVNHCMRTYLWGAILARAGGLRFDEELLFVASALHDLGLTAQHACSVHGTACFAVAGARAAQEFAGRAGWPAQRTERLVEAITLHLNVRVGLQHGAEAHLLHAGAGMDVVGRRRSEVHAEDRTVVLERYPRLNFKQQISAAIDEEARNQPDARAAFLVRLGFIGMIRRAGWDE